MIHFASGQPLRCVLAALALSLNGCEGTTGDLVTFASAGQGNAGQPNASAGAAPEFDKSWQIQLTGTLDTSLDVSLYELDLFALDASAVLAVHGPGRALSCYVSVGTAEPWRSDYGALPSAAIGNPLADYPQERWLDVRDPDVRSVMADRIALAARSGCDAVELSNLGGHAADSGFALKLADDLDYARFLIDACHRSGMTAGISGSDDLIPLLAAGADWGLAEECLAYDSCDAWRAFSELKKPVFMIEYGSASDAPTLCAEAATLGFALVIKRRALDAFRVGCPAISAEP